MENRVPDAKLLQTGSRNFERKKEATAVGNGFKLAPSLIRTRNLPHTNTRLNHQDFPLFSLLKTALPSNPI